MVDGAARWCGEAADDSVSVVAPTRPEAVGELQRTRPAVSKVAIVVCAVAAAAAAAPGVALAKTHVDCPEGSRLVPYSVSTVGDAPSANAGTTASSVGVVSGSWKVKAADDADP